MTTTNYLSHTLGQNIDNNDPDYSKHLLDDCDYEVSGTFQGLFCDEVWADPARALCSCSVFMKVKGQPCRLSS